MFEPVHFHRKGREGLPNQKQFFLLQQSFAAFASFAVKKQKLA